MPVDSTNQRLGRLTPLSAIFALIETRVGAAAPKTLDIEAARGYTLAKDVIGAVQPVSAIALRDGFPVDSALVADAGPYAPVLLPLSALRIDVGEPLPRGTDAVLPLDAVLLRGDNAVAVAPVVAGEGVLPAGGDVPAHTPLRRAGERVRAVDLAVGAAAGIKEVTVRLPKVHVVWGGDARSPVIEMAMATIIRVTGEAGGMVARRTTALELALADSDVDAIIAIGGTGSGQRDTAVHVLARHGRVEAHGIAISPGETSAFGFVDAKPVLLVPGRLDAALSVWLLVGRYLVAKLTGGGIENAPLMLPLKRKVTSIIGMTEVVPVGRGDGMADPLASGYLSFTTLAHSDGWIAVPAESEGFAAGALVAVNPWP